MKIRTGFVSNSSSSSFVLVVDTKAHSKAIKNMVSDDDYDYLLSVFAAAYATVNKLGTTSVISVTGNDDGGEYFNLGGFSLGEHQKFDEFAEERKRNELPQFIQNYLTLVGKDNYIFFEQEI